MHPFSVSMGSFNIFFFLIFPLFKFFFGIDTNWKLERFVFIKSKYFPTFKYIWLYSMAAWGCLIDICRIEIKFIKILSCFFVGISPTHTRGHCYKSLFLCCFFCTDFRECCFKSNQTICLINNFYIYHNP